MAIRLLDEDDYNTLAQMIEESSGGESTLVSTAIGKIIHVEDAKATAVKTLKLYDSNNSEITSEINIAITNKNLFRIDLIASSTTSNGITFTKNSDGSISASGTSTATYPSTQCTLDPNMFVVGKTYTISTGKTSGYLYVQLIINYADSTTDYIVARNSTTTFTISKEADSVTGSVQITDSGVTRDFNVSGGLGMYLKDGLHPNEKGQNLLARMIISSLKSHYVPFGVGFNN